MPELPHRLPPACVTLLLGASFAAAYFVVQGRPWLAATSTHVCVAVTVIGEEDVPLLTSPCDAQPVESSSVSSGGTSSQPAGTAGGVVSTRDGRVGTVTHDGSGGRRGDLDRQLWRTRALFERWRDRGLRPAGPTACRLPFTDVRDDAWYGPAVTALVCGHVLAPADRTFRSEDGATRAELAALLVAARGVATPQIGRTHFADLDPGSRFAAALEEAARRGWVRGYGDCYGSGGTCLVKPDQVVTRAEAAAMTVRAFRLKPRPGAVSFVDVPQSAWYARPVRSASSHCVLRGDDGLPTVRPEAPLSRAEMAVIVERLWRGEGSRDGCVPEAAPPVDARAPRSGRTPDGPSTTDGEVCEAVTPTCLAAAVAADAAELLASVLPVPGREALRSAPPAERLLWGTVAGWLVPLGWLVARVARRPASASER